MRDYIRLIESIQHLDEMPMTSIAHHGDMDSDGTFRADDRKKITNPVWQDRVVKLFKEAPVDIALHLVNGTHPKRKLNKETGALDPTGEYGFRYQPSKYAIDAFYPGNAGSYEGIHTEEWVKTRLGLDVLPGVMTAILISNEGSARVGLTPWMVGHRIAHAFFEANGREGAAPYRAFFVKLCSLLTSIVTLVEPKALDAGLIEKGDNSEDRIANVAHVLSPFRTARTHNIRDSGEYVIELFTQLLTSGGLAMNLDWLDEATRAKVLAEVGNFQAVLMAVLNSAVGKAVVL